MMINYINCFENIKKSNILYTFFKKNNLASKWDINKNQCKEQVEKYDIDNSIFSYYEYISNISYMNVLKEELKQIEKDNVDIFKHMKKHNILRKNKYLK